MNEDTRTETNVETELSSPIFDDRANAYAQPVTPIPKSRSQIFRENLRGTFDGGARSLAFIVVLGLTAGTLAGMALVEESNSSGNVARLEQSSEMTVTDSDQFSAVEAGASAAQVTSVRRRYPRVRRAVQYGGIRAYRVGVIR